MDISEMRREFESSGLNEEDLNQDPIIQFENWFQDARNAGILEPNAMSLATVDNTGQPTLRTVLLKYFDEHGFVFFTNYESRKAQNIEAHPQAAALFPWIGLNRQVSVQGKVRRISKAESFKYFSSRPRESQIGAWVSDQSKAINSRGLLEQKLAEMKRKFGDGKIPLPSFWGGYQIVPERIEFWQGRPHRLHDRFEYLKEESGWTTQRLQP
ncbi:pyridoxamine 5'-phosphate oxidase [Ketobacter alkanivorans]|uniref:Pyridoxine/pyridoxamine 5'-phosphate oxidase n=1 Tax=Ketobacter alkanivorans TaxID=1917421 RepID=A0A2K9LQ55_9GAMM|nr:pyridoxamine 5'-phosphate oxidase [Ketobacter alkanivorans]AUM14458.1 pyridoxamine 5'-phosphate oxidase [Ketobacter alkanivorans]MCP5014082.1 pyridoxamine 5'-phosphate oxidase [Ketobacter sp.]